jgi:hypothetical protein
MKILFKRKFSVNRSVDLKEDNLGVLYKVDSYVSLNRSIATLNEAIYSNETIQ